ncbi:MAG TPA: methyl-accepting chemotaxis protein [Burkholderiaceae bacterium]|nr:methyl-accepting chemotaxis protein [Burkholderiaceae bacterium]
MALKLPFKLPGGGGREAAGAAAPITIVGAPATMDPNATMIGRVVGRASSVRIPLIADKPISQQIATLATVLGVSLLLGIIVVALYVTSANKTTNNIDVAGKALMHSQRLARSAPNALQGSSAAFAQLRDSRDTLASELEDLARVTSDQNMPVLQKAQEKWSITEKAASVIVADEKLLLSIGATLRKINDVNPALLDLSEQVAALKLQTGAGAREISAASQLVMLTQRIAKNANQLLSGDAVNPEVSFQLGKDTNSFRDVLDALISGSDSLRLAATTDAETKVRLGQLKQEFQTFQQSVSGVLSSLPKIVAAKQAEQRIFNESEGLKDAITELRDSYVSEQRFQWVYFVVMGVFVAVALGCAVLIGKLFIDDSRVRAVEADRQRDNAERQEQEMKRVADQNQAAILRLMNELQEVADGDLTIQATVSEDITGAIADSVNYTVEELRNLVARINRTAEQVAGASSQAAQRSDQLLAASAEQSKEIKQTGESVLRMAQQINDISSSASESANVARQSLKAAKEGQRAVQNAISGMNEIREQIQETSKRIKRLGESSQEIGEIIELITDITEQTNVLALNAAIQAASAGEAGRGFSVVAEEVQRLAERSQEAAKQIGALIRAIQTDTQDAVAAMEKSTQGVVEGAKLSDEAGRALTDIGEVSNELAELIERISTSTSQQAASAGGVARSIEKILQVTEQTSEGTEQTARSIRELSELASELKASVARFRVV